MGYIHTVSESSIQGVGPRDGDYWGPSLSLPTIRGNMPGKLYHAIYKYKDLLLPFGSNCKKGNDPA